MKFSEAVKIDTVQVVLKQNISVYKVVNSLTYEFYNKEQLVFTFDKISENPSDLTSLILELINNGLLTQPNNALETKTLVFTKPLNATSIGINQTCIGYDILLCNITGKTFTSLLFDKEEIVKIMTDLL